MNGGELPVLRKFEAGTFPRAGVGDDVGEVRFELHPEGRRTPGY